MIRKLAHNHVYQVAVIVCFWLLVTAINASNLYIEFGDRYDGGWMNMFVRQLPIWIPWAVVTPLMILLLRQINALGKSVMIWSHLALLLGVLVVYTILQSVSGYLIYGLDESLFQYWLQVFLKGILVNLLIYTLILLLSYMLVWYKNYKEAEVITANLSSKASTLEKQLAEAKVQALTMQLNPHFLFNSLHSIASLIRTNRGDEAIDMIGGLGELLRTSTEGGKDLMVTLGEEIRFIESYLSLEQIRFKNKLKVEWEIDKSLLDVRVPRFLLQPAVENSLKHGLKDISENALLRISASVNNQSLILTVADNGIGLNNGWEESMGVGIRNTRERLTSIYGQDFEFLIAENGTEGTGVEVTLKLPAV